MRVWVKLLCTVGCAVLLLPICGFAPDLSQKIGADVIVTAAPSFSPLAALRGGERFPKGAQLLLVHEGKAEPLIAGFAASADANVSFDAQKVLFAGKKLAGDPWQIWELTLVGSFGATGDYGFDRRDTAVVFAGVAAGVRVANCEGFSTAVGAIG